MTNTPRQRRLLGIEAHRVLRDYQKVACFDGEQEAVSLAIDAWEILQQASDEVSDTVRYQQFAERMVRIDAGTVVRTCPIDLLLLGDTHAAVVEWKFRGSPLYDEWNRQALAYCAGLVQEFPRLERLSFYVVAPLCEPSFCRKHRTAAEVMAEVDWGWLRKETPSGIGEPMRKLSARVSANKRKNGICHCCPRVAIIGKTRCRECYEKDQTREKAKYERRRDLSVCVRCGVPTTGKSLCPEHLDHVAKRNRNRAAKNREEGKCKTCSAPAVEGFTRCAKHREAERKQARIYNRRRRKKATSGRADPPASSLGSGVPPPQS